MRRPGLLFGSAILWLPLFACLPVEGTGDSGTQRADAGSSNDAAHPDSSSGSDSGAVPCGNVTLVGECSGNVVRWCNNGALQQLDCATLGLICGMVDCDDPECFGYWCVANLGGACGLGEEDNYCNGGASQGCLHGVCAASTACVADTYTTACADTSYLNICLTMGATGTVWDFDCTSDGAAPYTCGTDSQGDATCLGVEGGSCDLTNDPPYECAAGFTCSSTTGEGTCQPS